MDPFSITLGVVTLTTLASKAGIELKKLRSGAAEATNNVNAMLADLKALKTVLDLIEDGFEDLDSRAPLTGHIGSHWSALQTTLGDGCESLQKLESLLVLVNKEVRYLDSARRALRLKEANDQIIMYRQEIQAYRDALQLSFQSVILSYDLHEDLGRLATNLEVKLTALETILVERQSTDNASISHLKRCARTAETVVASASTALGDDDTINESAATSDVVSEFHWLSSTSKGIFSEVYVPTIFENYIADFHVDGVDFKCTLWDTAGQSDFDRVRPTSYAQTDIFCICFSIDYPDSLGNVKDKWFPEISQYKRKTDPVFLLGFKEDLRHDPKTIEELSKQNLTPITTKQVSAGNVASICRMAVLTSPQGEALAKSIGVLKYFECSSIRHQGTKEIFETILSMVLMASPQLKKRYKSGNWRRRAINKLQPSS
ncbi:uncharacterized protein J4E78_006497 [Alternaria triticimaculans]|uniref:uncharacterized protein n=1 Tax=Alternaria triticimaculans TaxID=297637 RepID=UPI0020C2BA50|nr:uncharacterized protein J4E78_006497 [Alternaria triticimaculans]KAI4656608.1 hypothetical protein J4E78_006497 [Alternaria triticimaculans]